MEKLVPIHDKLWGHFKRQDHNPSVVIARVLKAKGEEVSITAPDPERGYSEKEVVVVWASEEGIKALEQLDNEPKLQDLRKSFDPLACPASEDITNLQIHIEGIVDRNLSR